MIIREIPQEEDDLLVDQYLALWDSYGTPIEHYLPDSRDRVRRFIRDARAHRRLAAYVADVDGAIAGSAACGLRLAPYPEVVAPQHRLNGYIWHVLVLPEFQRRGIGRALVEHCLAHLRMLGCATAILNASDAGAPLYRTLGFEDGTEMRRPL